MISYLEGKIVKSDTRSVVILSGGIGWRVFLGASALAKVQKKANPVKVFTHLYSREDTQELYGFETHKDLQYFELLLGVSGVGPRHAQLIVDSITVKEITGAITKGASEVFVHIPGIGTKLAKKIIIELQPKVKKLGLAGEVDLEALIEQDDVLRALQSLGYTQREARQALEKLPKNIKGISKRVAEALRILGKPR